MRAEEPLALAFLGTGRTCRVCGTPLTDLTVQERRFAQLWLEANPEAPNPGLPRCPKHETRAIVEFLDAGFRRSQYLEKHQT